MKKGMGIAVALGGISLLGTLYVTLRVEKDAKVNITPQMAEQFKGLNEIQAMALQGAVDAYAKDKGSVPVNPADLVPEYISEFPKESFSKLTSTVSAYDGKGGWVYESGGFTPNHDQKPNVP